MATKFKCPDCDKLFDSPQGVGPHRRKAHGYSRAGAQASKPRKPRAKSKSRERRPAPRRRTTTPAPTSNGRLELSGAEARLVLDLLSGRELQGSTIAELTDDDHVAIGLVGKLEGAGA
jgi:uncharacterized C2H2 Zn-finger protein